MLLDRADRDSQLSGNLPLADFVQPKAAEDEQRPLRQAREGLLHQVEPLTRDQLLFGRRPVVDLANSLSGNRPRLLARRPAAPGTVRVEKEIVGHAIKVGQRIRDRPRWPLAELQKDFLKNVLGFVRGGPARAKKTVQRVTICLERSREAAERLIGSRMNLDYLLPVTVSGAKVGPAYASDKLSLGAGGKTETA